MSWIADRISDFRKYPPTRSESVYALGMVAFWLWYWRCSP